MSKLLQFVLKRSAFSFCACAKLLATLTHRLVSNSLFKALWPTSINFLLYREWKSTVNTIKMFYSWNTFCQKFENSLNFTFFNNLMIQLDERAWSTKLFTRRRFNGASNFAHAQKLKADRLSINCNNFDITYY